jgi:hypothetical protein
MRNQLFTQLTNDQTDTELNTITNDVPNISTNPDQQNIITTMEQSNNAQNETDKKHERKLFLHPLYEKRFQYMKRGIHQIHANIFSESATKNVKMIVGNRNRRNAKHELIRKKPTKAFLKNKSRRSECFNIYIFFKISYSSFYLFK